MDKGTRLALSDIEDDLALAKSFIVCAYLACQSPTLPHDERVALSTVTDAARARLEAAMATLGLLIEAESKRRP